MPTGPALPLASPHSLPISPELLGWLEVGGGSYWSADQPVDPTSGHHLWPRSFLVGPIGLGTCLSFCHVGFLALVGPLIHVTTRVALLFAEKLYL